MKDTDFFSDALFQDLLFKWTSTNMLYLKIQKETKNRIPAAASSSASVSDASETARNHWKIKPCTNQIVCYSSSANTGPGSNYFSMKFLTTVIGHESEKQSVLILLFAYPSLCRLYDGKSFIVISKSHLYSQELGHPWGSKTWSVSVTNWTSVVFTIVLQRHYCKTGIN